MSSLSNCLRNFLRNLKLRLPYVRRREYRILQAQFEDLARYVAWRATPADSARIAVRKLERDALRGEVCLFVTHAPEPRLKPHVTAHLERLLAAGLQVALIINTDLAPDAFALDPALEQRLGAVFVRENLGFDFAAWAHAYGLCRGDAWERLYLINDSVIGPLDEADFERLLQRVRASDADLVGLTELLWPVRHLQSYFLVLGRRALTHPEIRDLFGRTFNLATKSMVIHVYERRLTERFLQAGLRVEALFPPLAGGQHDVDISYRWDDLIRHGFPYVKTSIVRRHGAHPLLRRLIPASFYNAL